MAKIHFNGGSENFSLDFFLAAARKSLVTSSSIFSVEKI